MVSVAEVPVVVAVPVVIMFNTAAISFPVTHKEPFAVVVRRNPTSALVGWASPIAFMPFIVPSHGIPITLHPHEHRTWPWG
jgi:hypothetical protein